MHWSPEPLWSEAPGWAGRAIREAARMGVGLRGGVLLVTHGVNWWDFYRGTHFPDHVLYTASWRVPVPS